MEAYILMYLSFMQTAIFTQDFHARIPLQACFTHCAQLFKSWSSAFPPSCPITTAGPSNKVQNSLVFNWKQNSQPQPIYFCVMHIKRQYKKISRMTSEHEENEVITLREFKLQCCKNRDNSNKFGTLQYNCSNILRIKYKLWGKSDIK